jgi:hypothetical protein
MCESFTLHSPVQLHLILHYYSLILMWDKSPVNMTNFCKFDVIEKIFLG